MPQFTPEQARAIHARKVSVALSAGAGCGKTFVLTQRFLAHIAPGDQAAELPSVVAITFTDRAAREMRDRVRRSCAERLTSCPPEEADHWQRLAREVDSARISTIHSFCMTLLRSHAVEAGIDPQSRLFDETTGAAFLRRSLVQSLHDLLVARDPDAMALVLAFNWEGALQTLADLVPQRYRLNPDHWLSLSPAALGEVWQTIWQRQAVPRLLREQGESPTTARLLSLLEENSVSNKTMAERRLTLLAELPALPGSRDPLAAIERILEVAQVKGGGSRKDWPSEEVYEEVMQALKGLREELKDLSQALDVDPTAVETAARISLAALRATVRAGQDYDQRKREEGWLDFDDLLIAARNLLRDHPTVSRRAAGGISLLMVDEFQDTDRLQAEIVKQLCGDDLTAGKLFLVGDVKQSIYRFRRAEPLVFRELRELLPVEGRLPLTGNFRSQPAILQFVNALCDGALGGEYEPLSPQTPQVSDQPCIEFLFSTSTGDPEDPGDDAPGEDSGSETVAQQRRREAVWIARRIRQLLTDGVPRVRERDPATGDYHLRPVEPRDVVLLFRAMTDVRYYEEALRELEIPHYVVGGRAFYSQQEVYDIVNLCRVLDDPDDRVALLGVLRSPLFSLTDDDLLRGFLRGDLGPAPAQPTPPSPGDASPGAPFESGEPSPPSPAARALATLAELRQAAARTPIAELLQRAIETTGYDAALLTEFLGDRKLANLRKLLDQAREFDRTGMFTLADYARHLSSAVAEESRESLAVTHPESSNVVRLMTIHQSKGLEFPVVVLTDMNRKTSNSQSGPLLDEQLGPLVAPPRKFNREAPHLGRETLKVLEAEEDLAETQRLLYVATTRAADLLILSASLAEGERGLKLTHPWMKLLNERFDLRTGQPRLNPGPRGVSVLARYSGQIPDILVHQTRTEVEEPAGSSEPHRLPLKKLRDAVEQAIPAPLPESLRSFLTATPQRDRFSVSELEKLVADQREHSGPGELDELLSLVEVEVHKGSNSAKLPPLKGDDSTTLGIVVHRAIELARPDPLGVLEQICRSSAVEVSPEVRRSAEQCLGSLAASPMADDLLQLPPTHREIDFLLPWPGPAARDSLVTGQIDALVPGDGGWRVVDYKTGTPESPRQLPHAALRKYGVQLGIYCLAVQQLTGRLPARLELIYLPSVTRLTITPTGEFVTRVVELVDRALAAAAKGRT